MKIGDIVTPTYSDMELFYGDYYLIVDEHFFDANTDNRCFMLKCIRNDVKLRFWYPEARVVLVTRTLKKLLEAI